jgi:hypothetical protein
VNASVFKNKILCDWDKEFEVFIVPIFFTNISTIT